MKPGFSGNHTKFYSTVMLFLVVLLCIGCGDGAGVKRYPLHGTVTFQGKPVLSGELMLSPNSGAGNSGPGSLAIIEKGKYSLKRNEGVIGGNYIIKISGFEGPPTIDSEGEMVLARELFLTYEMQVDLPSGGNFDVAVPDAATSR